MPTLTITDEQLALLAALAAQLGVTLEEFVDLVSRSTVGQCP